MSNPPRWLEHYEPGVPATIEIPSIPLYQLLVESAFRFPNHVAVKMVLKYLPLGLAIQSAYTYRQLHELSDRFAAALHGLGIQPGERVALMLPNLPQYVVAYFGALKAGAIIVNVNPTYTPRELQHQLADSGARAIVMLSGFYQRLAQIREQTQVEQVILTDVSDTLSWPFRHLAGRQLRAKGLIADVPPAPHIHRLDELLQRHEATPPTIQSNPDDVILLQYTGGTTGVPKAAMLTNRNLVSNVHQLLPWFTRLEPGNERVLGALPFFHVYGMTVGMLFAVATGGTLVIVPDPRDTQHILEVIHREKISIYPGVPAMYTAINNHPRVKEYDLRSVKACLSGGAALPVEVATRFEEITQGRLVEGYGLSESSPVAAANPIYGQRRVGSIGLPIPSTAIHVVSLEPDETGDYRVLGPGEEGELVIEGPQVMKGYWNRPDETALVIDRRGWLHTGDIGKMDEDGYFYIVDRKKDLIIASGYNVVPREVEEVLFMHPKVLEAAVAGIPDPKRGETVKAYVVLKPGESATEDEIRAFCRENLAPYKVPTQVEFRSELPKSQVGKVLRRLLVEEERQKQAAQKAAQSADPSEDGQGRKVATK
ncbi:MAG: long-chain-fatty-acid--CoA ligase [Litorilinea sp.]|nr:MAG: long-chain-fatty-acid--CoA ligase [Litorilinea sp.]